MPTLIVANCTKQHHDFTYREPNSKQIRKTHIAPGGQAYVYTNDDLNLVMSVIKPAMSYGMVPVTEIYDTHNFIGLCFSIDTPIDTDKIMETDEHNQSVQDRISDEIRQETAIAIHESSFNQKLPITSLKTEIREEGENKKFAKGVKIGTH
jgi:hypothetical protein